MKRYVTTALLTLAAVGLTLAETPAAKPVKYTLTMTGVVCSACKKKVRDSFTKSIGASKFEFVKGDKEGQQKVTFISTKPALTKDEATKALADFDDEFEVLALATVKEAPTPAAPK